MTMAIGLGVLPPAPADAGPVAVSRFDVEPTTLPYLFEIPVALKTAFRKAFTMRRVQTGWMTTLEQKTRGVNGPDKKLDKNVVRR